MQVPQEWIDQVIANLKGRPDLFRAMGNYRPIPDSEYQKDVDAFLNTPFNKAWNFNQNLADKFKDFFISMVTHQCYQNMHPLTCCSDHEILVPRINFKGECLLVCPTCGYTQPSAFVPVIFGENL